MKTVAADPFYFKLAKLRLLTFLVVGACALLFSGWRRDWVDWDVIWFETAIITFTAMILSLPLAYLRTKMAMKRQAKKRPDSQK